MTRKLWLMLAIGLIAIAAADARDVSVSNVAISNVNAGAGTADITYHLSRTIPTISTDQPIWIFVKYRLSTDDDFTGWQDTDDYDPANDASDNNVDVRTNTVNANLTGDVGIVGRDGEKTITWTWGGNGISLLSADSVRVRVYAIEMVKVGGGNFTVKEDVTANNRLMGTTQHSANDYYLEKYPTTARRYKDFLNACANRHDPGASSTHQFYRADQLQVNQNKDGSLTMSGTVGTDAQWDTYSVPNDDQADRPIVYVSWYNAYDYAAWAGLNLPEEEHWYKVAGESVGTGPAVSDWYWGNTEPSRDLCNYNWHVSHATDVNDYESAVDSTDGGNVYGAYELSGNVWEWLDTKWYSNGVAIATPYDASQGPTKYSGTSARLLRGGSCCLRDYNMRAATRGYNASTSAIFNYGFRCALMP